MRQQVEDQKSASTSIANFIPLEKIGEGSFSSVYKVRRITDDQIYALKKIKIAALKDKQKQNALNQIRILASLSSQYIVQYRQAFFDHKLNLLCVVMEYANEGDLQKKIQSYRQQSRYIPQNQVWKAAFNTLKALDLLHSKSILHRDIKSANIFISNGFYKLGDLNVSKVQDSFQRMAYTQTGTPYYASPQVWRDEPYDSKSDIWSLGCVLYEMCNYKPPFKGKDLQSLFKNVQKGIFQPLPLYYSRKLNNFISCFLQLNAKNRPNAKQVLLSKVINQKLRQLKLNDSCQQYNEQLLKTIKLPNDLKDLRKKLPKSKYNCTSVSYNTKFDMKNKQIQSLNNQKQLPSYYLQLARKKNVQANSNYVKLNRVISQCPLSRNPEDLQQYITKPQTKQISSHRILSSDRKAKIKQQEHFSEKYKNSEFQKKTIERSLRLKQKSKFKNNLEIMQNNRKLSREQPMPKSISPINLMKKLSQPSLVAKCYSQRNIQSKIQSLNGQENQYETERPRKIDKFSRNLLLSKRNNELSQIQKSAQQRRKQLRKIGSIQKLQLNNKNSPNLSYHHPHHLILQDRMKKGSIQNSNIYVKSPSSTEDQSSYLKLKQKNLESKKLVLNSQGGHQVNKVSSTPYMNAVSDAPRMKRILDQLSQIKKPVQAELKRKIMSNKYLYNY